MLRILKDIRDVQLEGGKSILYKNITFSIFGLQTLESFGKEE